MIDIESTKRQNEIIKNLDFSGDLKKLVDHCWHYEKQKKNIIKSKEFLHNRKIRALYGSRVTFNCNPSEQAKCTHEANDDQQWLESLQTQN